MESSRKWIQNITTCSHIVTSLLSILRKRGRVSRSGYSSCSELQKKARSSLLKFCDDWFGVTIDTTAFAKEEESGHSSITELNVVSKQ